MLKVLGASIVRHGVKTIFASGQVRMAEAAFSIASRNPAADSAAAAANSAARVKFFSSGADAHRQEVDEINAKFADAREEIELAAESKETVYFNEEVETARAAVQQVLDKFAALLARVSPEDKATLQRSMGLKMEQLKAELAQLKE